MDEILIRDFELPDDVKAITITDENCDYNVYVNSSLRRNERNAAINHELAHIKKQHFACDEITLNQLENEAR